jgi:hypothetical protein
MSKTLPSGSVKVVHLVPHSSNSAILVAPRATALDFGWEVSRDKVKVHPILALARFGHRQEHQRGKGAVVRGRDQCEELVGAVVDRAVEQGRPEGGDLVRALGIDDNLAKSNSHEWCSFLD